MGYTVILITAKSNNLFDICLKSKEMNFQVRDNSLVFSSKNGFLILWEIAETERDWDYNEGELNKIETSINSPFSTYFIDSNDFSKVKLFVNTVVKDLEILLDNDNDKLITKSDFLKIKTFEGFLNFQE